MDPNQRAAWTALKLGDLEQSCRREGATPDPDAVVLLGAAGRFAAAEVALVADAVRSDAVLGPVAALVVMRGYLRLGARREAEAHAALITAQCPSGIWPRVVAHELARGPLRSVTPRLLRAELAVVDGDVPGATGLLKEALDAPDDALTPLVFQEAVPMLSGMQLAQGDDAAALGTLARFLGRYPDADLAPRVRALHATLALARGDASLAEKLAKDESAHPAARHHARELVERMALSARVEAPLAAGPCPIAPGSFVGQEGRAVLRRLLGRDDVEGQPSSLGGIAACLRGAGLTPARCLLDEAKLAALLAEGARVVLAEERPVGTGFSEVLGYDAARGLLRVARFDRPGAALRTFPEQGRLSALHGLGALVLAAGKTRKPHRVHEPRLAILDAAEPDVRGVDTTRARAVHLTEQALEACPDVPRAHQLHGEALFEQLRAGELETSRADGPLEAWYASARLQFEQAEWAHQIYARCLDQWNASHEAAIAWADARALDDADYRNALGLSKNRLRQGYVHSARCLAAEALARVPEQPEAWAALAESALAAEAWLLAELCAHALLSVEPKASSAQRVLGLALERRGDLSAAVEVHLAAAGGSDDDGSAAQRASLACLRLARLTQARDLALSAMERDPAASPAYLLASMAFSALGEQDDARGVLAFGLSRVGPEPLLGERYAALLAASPPTDQRKEALSHARTVWAEHELMLLALADALSDAGDVESAASFFQQAHQASGRGVGSVFREARALVRRGRIADAEALLAPLVEQSDNAFVVSLLHGLRQKLGHAPSLSTLQKASPDAQPALVWGLTHATARQLGDRDLEQSLEERLFGLPAEALVDAARFCAEHLLADAAEALLALRERHRRPSVHPHALHRAAHALAVARADHSEAARLSHTHHVVELAAEVSLEELDAALCAAAFDTLGLLAEKRRRWLHAGADAQEGDGAREAVLIAAACAARGERGELDDVSQRYASHPALESVLSHPALCSIVRLRGERP
jgi:tetratricopeptide (TPR) repeat protein